MFSASNTVFKIEVDRSLIIEYEENEYPTVTAVSVEEIFVTVRLF
jgi:hypothetical protein